MIRHLAGCALLLAAVTSGCAGGGDDAAAVQEGGYATHFEVREVHTGAPVDLASFRGRPVLLSSWATWCEECRTELPALDRWAAEHEADGLAVVAVNVNLSGPADDEIDQILADLDLDMPTWRDDQNLFARTFRTFGVPANVLLDSNGRVVSTWNGAIDPNEPEVVAALSTAFASAP